MSRPRRVAWAVGVAVVCALAAAPARADAETRDAAVALPITIAERGAADAYVELPPAVFAHLRHGTDDVRVVDAAGRPLASSVRPAPPDQAPARVDLEPRLVSRSAAAGEVSFLFDLRVRAAPALEFELDLRGAVGTPVRAADAHDPRAGPWEELPFRVAESGAGRVVGRAGVPQGAGKRWVRVVVPAPAPGDVRVARAAATIRRHRVHFRPAHGTAPFTLLVGFAELPLPAGPHLGDPIGHWSFGVPAHVPAPDWLPPEPGLGGAPADASPDPARPFPAAELVATLVALALTIWAVLLRREG